MKIICFRCIELDIIWPKSVFIRYKTVTRMMYENSFLRKKNTQIFKIYQNVSSVNASIFIHLSIYTNHLAI